MILNDSSLFSNSAEITTKEILRRYGDRAKAPTVNSQHPNLPSASNGTTSPTPVVTRVETDQHVQNAWQNESSVRHVGSDRDRDRDRDREGYPGGGGVGGAVGGQTPPSLPYANPRGSQDSNGSPNRGSIRAGAGNYDKQRAMGVA